MRVLTRSWTEDEKTADGQWYTSGFHYAAAALLYQDTDIQGETLQRTAEKLLQRFPAALQPAAKRLLAGGEQANPKRGPDLRAAAAWLESHPEECRARRPNNGERARILGAPEYWAGLAQYLDRRGVHDAQGNAFDPRAVAQRIGPRIEAWLQGQDLPVAGYPSIAQVQARYNQEKQQVMADGHPAQPFPGWDAGCYAPLDPPSSLTVDEDEDEHNSGVEQHTTSLAAEDGRGGR